MPIDPNFDFALGDVDAYRKELLADAQTIVSRAGSDALDPEASDAFKALRDEIHKVDADVEARTAIKDLAEAGHTDEVRFTPPQVNVNLGGTRDVFDLRNTAGLTGQGLANELRARALTAIENAPNSADDNAREAATRMVEERNDGAEFSEGGSMAAPRGSKANHILRTGSPQYVREFQEFMRNPSRGPSDHLRAMSEASTSVGGAVVPYFLDPTIVETNAGVISPIRQLATVRQITTNIWHGVTSAGVTAEWIGEASEVTDASPTFVQPTITTYKADAYLQASMELIADAAISGEISALLGDAKARLEGTAFVTGTGTAQPKGLITATSGTGPQVAGSSGAAGAADLVAADIFALANALPPRWRSNGATFLGSLAVINKIRQLNAGTAAYQSTFWADFGAGTPPNLIGYPIFEVSDMDTTIVSGSNDDVLLFGDIGQYFIIDRIGMEIAYNPLVVGANRRPTGESGWVAFWRTGADVNTSNAFKLLRL
jgi:HK97 family phage major capsid protein